MAGRVVRSSLLARVLSITLLHILSLDLIAAGPARLTAASDETFSITTNIHVSPDLQPRFKAMLAASPTFRSQCQRLSDQTDLYVRLIVDPRLTDGSIRARSVISRLHSGAVVAFVSIGASPDPAEWLAHEIEHVIEQLEGVKRSEEHTSELHHLGISYAVFCLKKKKKKTNLHDAKIENEAQTQKTHSKPTTDPMTSTDTIEPTHDHNLDVTDRYLTSYR